MTRDDIIRMAREAGLHELHHTDLRGQHWIHLVDVAMAQLARFADLVAAAEREACAALIESRYMGDHNREDQEVLRCAAAIRARGQS